MGTHFATSPRYRVVETIGRGGMGEVCLAEDAMLHRSVALKFLTSSPDDRSAVLGQLLTEARSAAALDHPFICKIYEVTNLDGRPCIVMEYVRGETLERLLRRGPLSLAEGLRLAEEIAEALEAAHKRRLVHRDLKPANVMVTEDGHIKVMDFGLATRGAAPAEPVEPTGVTSATGDMVTVRGTPAYMSPEHISGRAVDHRTDIFAFGVMLYQSLSGTHPFLSLSLEATVTAILTQTPKALDERVPGMPKAVAAAVARMLAKDPAARYPSFAEVRLDLRRVASELGPAMSAAPSLVDASPTPASRLQFLGRESLHADMVRNIRQVMTGRGTMVLVGGEAGVGKSRLAEEALGAARELGCLPLRGHCYEQQGTPPLVPYVEILEDAARLLPAATFRDVVCPLASELARMMPELHRMFPELPPPLELPPDLRQRFLFNNIRDFLIRCGRVMPLAIVLDDLQWADESTLRLTQHLAQHLERIPAIVIGTYRDIDVPPERERTGTFGQILQRVRGQSSRLPTGSGPLRRTVDQLLGQRHAREIVLGPLSDDAVVAMLAALGPRDPPPGLVRLFLDATGGNPFFVEELFQHLREEGRLLDPQGRWRRDVELDQIEVPAGIRTVISRRLKRLSGTVRQALTAAAVIGRRFDLDVLEAVADLDAKTLVAAMAEAEQMHLVKGPAGRTEDRWQFAHQLICHTLAGALPKAQRERTHLRVADALIRLDPESRVHTADIAHHLYGAGRMSAPSSTARALTAAGKAADDVYATDEALRHYRRALEMLRALPDAERDRLQVQERLADLMALSGDSAGAMEHYTELAGVLERAGAAVDHGRTIRKIGGLQWQSGRRAEATSSYARALELLERERAHMELAHLHQQLGLAAFRSGDNKKAIEWSERALRSAESALEGPAAAAPGIMRMATIAIAHATNTIGVALARSGSLDAARERIEQSVASAHEHGLLDVACRGYSNLGVLYCSLEPKRAIEVSRTGLDLATKIGAASLQPYMYANLATAYCALTDRCEAEGLEAAQAAAALDRELGQLDHLAVPLIVMAQIYQCKGDLQQAREMYHEALGLAEKTGEPQLLFPCYDGLATIHLDRGDRSRAEQYLEKARELCERAAIDPDTLMVLPFLS